MIAPPELPGALRPSSAEAAWTDWGGRGERLRADVRALGWRPRHGAGYLTAHGLSAVDLAALRVARRGLTRAGSKDQFSGELCRARPA